MGRKCGVEGCLSDSSRPEDTGVTFHKVPMHSDIRPKWISLCRIPDDKKNMKVIYICSRHFLRMDFCNFKGKKYMLRQGVLPSVFPWDKSKLEAIKSTTKNDTDKMQVKEEVASEDVENTESSGPVPESGKFKEEQLDTTAIKETAEGKDKIKINANGPINFAINSRIEALDNNNMWYPARIVEEDYEENEVLVHFEQSNKHDEWICMDSPRLRPLQSDESSSTEKATAKKTQMDQYAVGERCLASWSDARKFPATVTKILHNDTYEVLFDDGFVKNLKAHRMCKAEGRPMQSSPLFDPIQSTKQERREKKRKINIAELFGKKQRLEGTEERSKAHTSINQQTTSTLPSGDEIFEPWVPQWDKGRPVGVESSIDAHDGTRKSIIVPDPRLPEGWTKHLAQRVHGASAGKWDTIIVSPDNRRFRSRTEVKAYLEETKMMKYNWSMFDFSIHRHRNRKKDFEIEASRSFQETSMESLEEENTELLQDEEENKNLLKIPIVDDAYQCPIEGCGKTYRKENLAQMHVKHYHPEYTKFLDSTPNVADLAYARTVGESLDKSPGVKTPVAKPIQKSATSRSATRLSQSQSPQLEVENKPQSPVPVKNNKDSEIIKLLNTKPFEHKKEPDSIKPLPAGLPSSMYPDIKLKDLLNKSEGIPNRDDLNLRALSSTRPPTGIKTLLPVVRPEKKETPQLTESDGNRLKSGFKRKRGLIDSVDSPKGNEPTESAYIVEETAPIPEPNNIIIEGDQVIKIVRMKQEEIINCTCGYTEEDGLMIQCDLCLCWQHAFCNNIERESQVPEKYVCYICQNPAKQRMSKKYYHDQDWLKHGVLATTNFHTKDEEALNKRAEKLKKSHDISGGLIEVREFVNSLKVKLKIAEAKNHPKLYLWSKPWEKLPLPEKVKQEDVKPNIEKCDEDAKGDCTAKAESADSMLMMILKSTKDEVDDNLNGLPAPIVPQPEAAIDSADCRLNLLEHIAYSQSLVEERLDEFQKQIEDLEDASFYEDDVDYPRTRQTLNMLLRDLNTLQELSQLTTL